MVNYLFNFRKLFCSCYRNLRKNATPLTIIDRFRIAKIRWSIRFSLTYFLDTRRVYIFEARNALGSIEKTLTNKMIIYIIIVLAVAPFPNLP